MLLPKSINQNSPPAKTKRRLCAKRSGRNNSITAPTPKFLKAIAERASAAPLLKDLLDPAKKHDLQVYLWGMEVIDFLLEHTSVKLPAAEFVSLLTKLQKNTAVGGRTAKTALAGASNVRGFVI